MPRTTNSPRRTVGSSTPLPIESFGTFLYFWTIVLSSVAHPFPGDTAMELFAFGPKTDFDAWRTVDDDVMGGVSQSVFVRNSDSTAVFEGTVSPENNGGFASVRTSLSAPLPAECATFVVRVLGDGKTYSLRCRTDERLSGITYDAPFTTRKGEWTEHRFEIDEFSPVFRGRPVPDAPALKASDIRQIGFLIARKQFGDFRLIIDGIRCESGLQSGTR